MGEIWDFLRSVLYAFWVQYLQIHISDEKLVFPFEYSVVLSGRPEKLPDVCYSWWVLASLKIIGRLHWIDKASCFISLWFYIYLNLVDLNIWVIGCFIIINILIKFQKLWTQYESYEFLRLMDKDSYMSPQLLEIFLLWRGCNTWLTFGFSERWVIPL